MAQTRPLAVEPSSTKSQILPNKPTPVLIDRLAFPQSHPSPRGRGRGSRDLHTQSGRGAGSSHKSAPRRPEPHHTSGSSSAKTHIPPSDTPTLSYSKGELKGAINLRKPPPSPLKSTSLLTPSISSPDPDRERTKSQDSQGPHNYHKHSTPTTPRHDRDKLHPPAASPAPLSPHIRSKRGGGRNKKNKDVSEPAPSAIDDAKPLSIEDAVAQLKKNPFDGGPLVKSPKPSPLPSPALPPSKSKTTATPAAAKSIDVLSISEQDPRSLPKASGSPVEQITEQVQHLTTSPVPEAPSSTSRPHTPSTHIDWAGDDDDGSLPDLDDWATPAPTANFVLPEVKTINGDTDSTRVSITIESPTSPATNNLSIKGAAIEILHSETIPSKPVGPAHSTTHSTPVPTDSPQLNPVNGNVQSIPVSHSAPPHPPSLRPSPSDASLRQPPPRQTPARPVSFGSFGRDRERLHSRTRSLPQDRKAHHASRPIISAVGLSRISKSLASGTISTTVTKKDADA